MESVDITPAEEAADAGTTAYRAVMDDLEQLAAEASAAKERRRAEVQSTADRAQRAAAQRVSRTDAYTAMAAIDSRRCDATAREARHAKQVAGTNVFGTKLAELDFADRGAQWTFRGWSDVDDQNDRVDDEAMGNAADRSMRAVNAETEALFQKYGMRRDGNPATGYSRAQQSRAKKRLPPTTSDLRAAGEGVYKPTYNPMYTAYLRSRI